MTKNEIKKMLYKDDPCAYLHEVRKDGIVYILGDEITRFLVPLEEVGEVKWTREIPAKLLIRYLINVED